MLLDGVGYGHSNYFLEWNFFCPLNELLRGGKDPNVLVQGQALSVECFGTLMS